jgi:hypothetical protein
LQYFGKNVNVGKFLNFFLKSTIKTIIGGGEQDGG